MKKIYFTVGPSQVYPTLYKHLNQALKINIPSLNHRGADFKELFKQTTNNLKTLLNIPESYQIFFVSSALEAMEITIMGLTEKTSFHIITGSFGKAWANFAAELGKNVLKSDLLYSKIPKETELICITQNDTSTGFWIPMEDIYNLKKKYPEKLIAIDIVSSIPYVDIDYKYIDVAFFSVQKGFGLPAGLGIMIVSPKALEKTERLRKKLAKKGFIIGAGYGDNKLNHLRIANFPSHTLKNVIEMLKYI